MAFGGGLEDSDEMMSDINMTPLVDVMLVLLIIFIITVPVLTHTVKLDLPWVTHTPAEVQPETITLSISATGELHWNQDPLTLQELEVRLSGTALLQPQPEIHIRGDRSVNYEHVINTMATVQRAGILKLGFITEPGH